MTSNESRNVIEEANFCLAHVAHEDSLLQSYRMIFLAFQAILFGFSLALLERSITEAKWFSAPGISFSVLWLFVCHSRAKELDAWRNKLTEITEGTEIGEFLNSRWKSGSLTPLWWLYRFTFNYAIPVMSIIAWIVVILKS